MLLIAHKFQWGKITWNFACCVYVLGSSISLQDDDHEDHDEVNEACFAIGMFSPHYATHERWHVKSYSMLLR